MSKDYRIRVTRIGDENHEYSFYSFYTANSTDHTKAENEARKQFCEDFGALYDQTTAYTFNKLSHEK